MKLLSHRKAKGGYILEIEYEATIHVPLYKRILNWNWKYEKKKYTMDYVGSGTVWHTYPNFHEVGMFTGGDLYHIWKKVVFEEENWKMIVEERMKK